MRSLTANDAIRIWESGGTQAPAEQAITVLSAAFPEARRDELRGLTLGRRNARLLELREVVFGSAVNGFAECSNCGERLEFTLDSKSFRGPEPSTASESPFDLESEGYALSFRPLNTGDLNAAASVDDVDTARQRLIERCVLEARRGERVVTVAELPETVITELAQRLAGCDPEAEVLIDLRCPACECRQQLPFDIATFFCVEIGAEAQRLLQEVHTLARAYGWHENEILAMSARRRHFYIEMLEQ